MNFSLKNIVVQQLIRSPFAHKYYRLAPQLKPVASVDLDDIETREQLLKYWNQIVGLYGNFALSARDKKGMFKKTIAIMRVSRHTGITFKDERCALASRFRRETEKREGDLEI